VTRSIKQYNHAVCLQHGVFDYGGSPSRHVTGGEHA